MDPDDDSAAKVIVFDAAKTGSVDRVVLMHELRTHLIVVLAGLAAESLAGYPNDKRNVADLNKAGDLADRLASLASTNETLVEQVGTIIEDATADAFALLTANWAAVVRVARVLQKHDYLVDCDLDDIIAHGRRGR